MKNIEKQDIHPSNCMVHTMVARDSFMPTHPSNTSKYIMNVSDWFTATKTLKYYTRACISFKKKVLQKHTIFNSPVSLSSEYVMKSVADSLLPKR